MDYREATDVLRGIVKRGQTLFTLRVSKDVYVLAVEGGRISDITLIVACALQLRLTKYGAIRQRGSGYSIETDVVSQLGHRLYGDISALNYSRV